MTMAINIHVQAVGLVCACGNGAAATRQALFSDSLPAVPLVGGSGTAFDGGRSGFFGEVVAPLPDLSTWAPQHRTRTNALADLALSQIRFAVDAAVDRFGPLRVGVVIGGSTSGLREGELALRQRLRDGAWPEDFSYSQQELGATAAFIAERAGIAGPVQVVSTACSSGAKALASAARWLRAGLVDAVVAGGADALCRFTVAGFTALESVSAGRCNPLSRNRDGIHLGEGAALFVLSREPSAIRLSGWGESGDAHHMSAPAPDGRGAIAAMRQALARAGISPAAVDYVNLHGTATPQNDAMESLAVGEVLGGAVAVSSTKPITGHALGAAGAIEAAFCALTLMDNRQGRLPTHWWDGVVDPALRPMRVVTPGFRLGRSPRHILSNSFAFGGSNASLMLSAE
jgi:3-oxoacyl-[acyl-carrier-protein] synthase-1